MSDRISPIGKRSSVFHLASNSSLRASYLQPEYCSTRLIKDFVL